MLFHDAQYFDDEYLSHVGWGHSAISQTVALARRADVKQVVLFHHDPAHSDADLERLLAIARDLWQDAATSPVWRTKGWRSSSTLAASRARDRAHEPRAEVSICRVHRPVITRRAAT